MKLSQTTVHGMDYNNCCLLSIGEIKEEVEVGDRHHCKDCNRFWTLTDLKSVQGDFVWRVDNHETA